MNKLIILLSLICFSFVSIHANYLKTSRNASVKTMPLSNARVVSKVNEGVYLLLLDDGKQENGYYKVQLLNTNQTGWIYRTFARRYKGDIPEYSHINDNDNPLADPTYFLTEIQKQNAKRHLSIGKPQAVYERIYQGYVVGYDARLKVPVWVQYELTRSELDGAVSRTDNFSADYSIPFGSRSELSDYYGSGYDRGHMAPAADMKRSEIVMTESFYLSNISPQTGIGFNRGLWAQLEEDIRRWVRQRGTLSIITGPVFMPENKKVSYNVIGENNVAVPTHFYKIIVDINDQDNIRVLAFLMPNKAIKDGEIVQYLTSIDFIEKLTGLDFLSSLPGEIQDKIENEVSEKIW